MEKKVFVLLSLFLVKIVIKINKQEITISIDSKLRTNVTSEGT
jgi:hypothetical protein